MGVLKSVLRVKHDRVITRWVVGRSVYRFVDPTVASKYTLYYRCNDFFTDPIYYHKILSVGCWMMALL